MTTPQDPWQQGGYQQYPQGGQQFGTPSGGFPASNQPQGYGNPYAAPQVPAHELAGPPAAPQTVNTAFWIAMVMPLLTTVLTVVMFLVLNSSINDLINTSLPQDEELGPEFNDSMRSFATGFIMAIFIGTAILYAILSALWILFGFKMRAGRNWARVTLTVFAGIWLLSSISGLATGTGNVSTGSSLEGMNIPSSYLVLGYVNSGLGLLAMAGFITLVFLKPSNNFFQAAKYRY
ncbi:hypothetical protein [Saccharopolyspora taberi]|uniref:hypothetical protein n=1 Tax=Saccharopolyspora taberi TaxID=60895 RepID=UPI0031D40044